MGRKFFGEGNGNLPALRQTEGRAAFSLEFRPPGRALQAMVETYYLYHSDAADVYGVSRVDAGQLRFMLRGEGVFHLGDERTAASLPAMINPPGTVAARYHVRGPFRCFGVSLRPIGWRALVGRPASATAGNVLDATALLGDDVASLLERLRTLDTIEEMIAAVEPMLKARRRAAPRSHIAFLNALREWTAEGSFDLDAFYDAVPLSRRQVMRLSNEYFAGPPTLLRRKYRALTAAIRLRRGESANDVSAPFTDHPHMIRELKHFTGHTPTSLRNAIDPVLAATLDRETFHILPEVLPESVEFDAE